METVHPEDVYKIESEVQRSDDFSKLYHFGQIFFGIPSLLRHT